MIKYLKRIFQSHLVITHIPEEELHSKTSHELLNILRNEGHMISSSVGNNIVLILLSRLVEDRK